MRMSPPSVSPSKAAASALGVVIHSEKPVRLYALTIEEQMGFDVHR